MAPAPQHQGQYSRYDETNFFFWVGVMSKTKRKKRNLGFGNQYRSRDESVNILLSDVNAYDTQAQQSVEKNTTAFLKLAEEARSNLDTSGNPDDLCLNIVDDPDSPSNYSLCFACVKDILNLWKSTFHQPEISRNLDAFMLEFNSGREPDEFLWMHLDMGIAGRVIPRIVPIKNAAIAAICYAQSNQEAHTGN